MQMMVFKTAIGMLLAACVVTLGLIVRELIDDLRRGDSPAIPFAMLLMFSGVMLWALFLVLAS